jgi:hypothetical protein
MVKEKRLIPTGECWCGCGEEAKLGSFFLVGHDKKAESVAIELEFDGSVAQFLDALGFAPGGKRRTEFERAQKARRKKQ